MYAHTWVWKTVECSTSFTVFINMIIEIECKIHPREMNSMKPQASRSIFLLDCGRRFLFLRRPVNDINHE